MLLAADACPTANLKELNPITDWIALMLFFNECCNSAKSMEEGDVQ